MNIWQILGIKKTNDIKEIKLAYAKKIKEKSPEHHPEEFQQIRKAYQKALDYISGKSIDDNIQNSDEDFSSHIDALDLDEHQLERKSVAMVELVLNELQKNEYEAFNALDSLAQKHVFDDLALYEAFQQELAISLLTFSPMYNQFILYCIDFFQWRERIIRNRDNTVFRRAVINLINNAAHFRLCNEIYIISKLKNKKEAIKHNVTFNEVRAARVLIAPKNWLQYHFIILFRRKTRKAIFEWMKKVLQCPEVIGIGLNLYAVSWWKEVYIKNRHKPEENEIYFSILFFLMSCMILASIMLMDFSSNTNSNQAEISSNSIENHHRVGGTDERLQEHMISESYQPNNPQLIKNILEKDKKKNTLVDNSLELNSKRVKFSR